MASESLAEYLDDKNGVTYYLMDNMYCASQSSLSAQERDSGFNGSVFNDSEGKVYNKGIDKFILEALKDKDCIGLVPLTEKAAEALNAKPELSLLATGNELRPNNIQFSIYGVE